MTFSKETPDYYTSHEYQTRGRNVLELRTQDHPSTQSYSPRWKREMRRKADQSSMLMYYYKETPGNFMQDFCWSTEATGHCIMYLYIMFMTTSDGGCSNLFIFLPAGAADVALI